MKKIGKQSIEFENPVYFASNYSLVGPKEGLGNFGQYFHEILKDDKFGQPSYEKAESQMLLRAVDMALRAAELDKTNVDAFLSGDLMNQIISSSFAARELQVPFLGTFGACSTMIESLLLGAMLVDGGLKNVVCASGSHFSSAEKQFRYPLELGTQRPPTSQWTVTGSGCSVLTNKEGKVRVAKGTVGKVVDWAVSDVNNMGGAMAPAALETLYTFFQDTQTTPDDYDLILTGDLGKLGSEVLRDLMEYRGYKLGSNYSDCGHMYYTSSQKVFQGGSGCGCIATVLNSYVLERLQSGKARNAVVVATGALMSTLSSQQGESVPGIAHLVLLESLGGVNV